MACATPVVSTDAGGVSEVVEHGVTGLLSPVDDLEGFARHMAALLFGEVDAAAMGATARAHAVERFRRELVVERYEALYGRVLAARS
jgi:glycosyltransferase involved in cell wall biosynthesis